MEKLPDLAIILPVYNPRPGWPTHLENALRQLQRIFESIDYQVIVTNDGSTQHFDPAAAGSLAQRYPELRVLSYTVNRGKGAAIRFAMARVETKHYIYTDFDFPFGFAALRRVYDLLHEGRVDVVMSRRTRQYLRMLPPMRRFVSRALRWTSGLLTGFRIDDTQAGLKGFNRRARALFLTLRTDGFLFEVEFARKMLRRGLRYQYISVSPAKDLHLPNFSLRTLWREFKNWFRVLWR